MNEARITKRMVDGLEPRDAEYTAWDRDLTGFGVRVRPTGSKAYIVAYRAGRGRAAPYRRQTIGATNKLAPEQAREEAERILAGATLGADPAAELAAAKAARAEERNAPKVRDLLDRFLTEHAEVRLKARTAAGYRQIIEEALKPELGDIAVRAVTPAQVAALHHKRRKNRDGSESTAPKAYGAKNNCIRAARKALGAEAQPGVDFELACTEAGWTWTAKAEASLEAHVEANASPAWFQEGFDSEAAWLAAQAPAEPVLEAPKAPAGRPARVSSEAVQAKRRAMLAAADAKGFAARWNTALEAARAGELPAAPDFSKPTHVSGRKWLAEAVALQAAGDLEGLRVLVYDPEGSTGGALHRFVRFSIAALNARGGQPAD